MLDAVSLADEARDAGDWSRAAELYEAALERHPLRADLLVQRGHALKESGRLAEAEACYRHATELAPGDADAHLQLGHALKLLGRRAEAIRCYETALRLAPGLQDAANELFHLGAAEHQEAQFTSLDAGTIGERLAELGAVLQRTGHTIEAVRARLPDLLSRSAFPVRFYRQYRTFNPVQEPPGQRGKARRRTFTVVSHAAGWGIAAWEHQLRSLQAQSHRAFRFFGIGSGDHHRVATERLSAIDDRFHWCEAADPWAAERGIVAGTESDAVLLMGPGRELHPAALEWFAYAFDAHTAAGWICDEEVLQPDSDGGSTLVPLFRRMIDRDTLREANPYGETVALRRDAFLTVSGQAAEALLPQRHRLLASLLDIGPVGHIPLPLSRHRAVRGVPAQPAPAHSAPPPDRRDGVEPIHIIIPTTSIHEHLSPLLDSLVSQAGNPARLHFHLVENRQDDPSHGSRALLTDPKRNISTYHMPTPFNWSLLNNHAAKSIRSGIIVFLNDDMVMLSRHWDLVVRDLLSRPGVGAVGAKLTYPDGLLQHAGMMFGWQHSTIHDGLDEPQDAAGPAMRWQTTRAVSAVTGAFIAIRAEVFEQVGGFDEDLLMVNYSDVDLALRLRRQGFRIVWSPHVHLTHYEGRSRGYSFFRPERQALWDAEHEAMRRRWGLQLDCEPSVHPVFLDATRPFRLLRPLTSAMITEYMALTSHANPWNVEMGESPEGGWFPA